MTAITDLAMGLRADEAREILVKNNYTHEEYLGASRAINDASGYLYGLAGAFGGVVAGKLEQTVRCSAQWISDPTSCEIETPMISFVIGCLLGAGVPFFFLRYLDRKEISESEHINRLRNSVIKVIDDNYQGCKFHSPLEGVHISELLKLADGDTQRQLLDRLNKAQAVQALKHKSEYSTEVLANVQKRAKSEEGFDELRWEKEVKSEVELWTRFESTCKTQNADRIGQVYAECRRQFGSEAVKTFLDQQGIKNETVQQALNSLFLDHIHVEERLRFSETA